MVSLIGLAAAANCFYLVSLYRSIRDTTDRQIRSAMVDMNIDETWDRFHRNPRPPKEPNRQAIVSRPVKGSQEISTSRTDSTGSEQALSRRVTTIDESYSNQMIADMNEQIHAQIDPYYPIQLQTADSLLKKRLSERGIEVDFVATEIVDTLGNVLQANLHHITESDGLDSYTLVYNSRTGMAYRAYISSVTRNVLARMTGVIVTTLLLVLLFTISFIYLYRTLCRLRTIEEMKDDFVSNMTHELKTPIAIAYSANDALLHFDAANDPERRERYLGIANRQLKRLGTLVEQILAMSMQRRKSLTLKQEKVDVCALAREIAATQRMRTEKPVSIGIRASQPEIFEEIDRNHLAGVLNNLIDNAIKYSGDEVQITLALEPGRISVEDNGIGISAKHLPYIFNRFYRVPHGNRQDVRGYGIGLYYVSSILTKMGWQISVKSRPGRGSKFTLTRMPQR